MLFCLAFTAIWFVFGIVCILVGRHLKKKEDTKEMKQFNNAISKLIFILGGICIALAIVFCIIILIKAW